MKSEKGQSLVEFALVIPILLMLLFGIVDFGRALHVYLTLDHAGRDAARTASIGAKGSDIISAAHKSSTSISLETKGTVTVNYDKGEKDASGNAIVYPLATGDRAPSGSNINIELEYPFDFITPLIDIIISLFDVAIKDHLTEVIKDGKTVYHLKLEDTTVMRVE